jgi:carbonic anhydrase
MKTLSKLFESNKQWAAKIVSEDHEFFERLSKQQSPQYLWIGCADSRVPATEICGLQPGEIFVHRNVANLVVHTDLNCLSVVQYAVEVLKVRDVIICGHYGCGGVNAALSSDSFGLIDNWLMNIKSTAAENSEELKKYKIGSAELSDRMCELNVVKQVYNLAHTTIIQDAWKRGQELNLHGWIYRLNDGILKDMGVTLSSKEQIAEMFKFD